MISYKRSAAFLNGKPSVHYQPFGSSAVRPRYQPCMWLYNRPNRDHIARVLLVLQVMTGLRRTKTTHILHRYRVQAHNCSFAGDCKHKKCERTVPYEGYTASNHTGRKPHKSAKNSGNPHTKRRGVLTRRCVVYMRSNRYWGARGLFLLFCYSHFHFNVFDLSTCSSMVVSYHTRQQSYITQACYRPFVFLLRHWML